MQPLTVRDSYTCVKLRRDYNYACSNWIQLTPRICICAEKCWHVFQYLYDQPIPIFSIDIKMTHLNGWSQHNFHTIDTQRVRFMVDPIYNEEFYNCVIIATVPIPSEGRAFRQYNCSMQKFDNWETSLAVWYITDPICRALIDQRL